MKILFLCDDDPLHTGYGGGQRNKAMFDALQRVGAVDTLWVAERCGEHRNVVEVREGLHRIETPPPRSLIDRWRNRLFVHHAIGSRARKDYDAVVARNIAVASFVPPSAHERLIFDCDDFKRSIVHPTSREKAYLAARNSAVSLIARRAAHCWLANESDAKSLAAPPGRSSVLPNIVNPFQPQARKKVEGGRLLMVAGYGYPPNRDGLLWFAEKVLPKLTAQHPSLQLHAVGAFDDTSLSTLSDNIVMRGFVDSLPEEYARADAVICPIRSGSGTQIKLLEGLLSTRPVISSQFSYDPLQSNLQSGKHLLVARGAAEWVTHINSVLAAPDKFEEMGRVAREKVLEAYGPSVFQDEVRRTIVSVVAGRSMR